MKKHYASTSKIIATIICCFSLQTLVAQWPQFRGPNRDGISSESNLLKEWPENGPKLAWSVDVLGEGFASAVIQDDMAFTTGKKDSIEILTAMDLNGKVLWQKTVGRASSSDWWPQGRATPTVYKGKVYAITVKGDIACFDCKTGHEDWTLQGFEKFEGIGNNLRYGGISESPLIEDDKLIITPCGKKTTVVALNRLNGETIWTSESLGDTTRHASPVLIREKGKKILITSTANYTIAVDFNDGKIIWKDKQSRGILPTIDKNTFYFTGEYKKGGILYGLNADMNGCSVLRQDTLSGNYMGGTLLLGNKIVGSSENKNIGLFCLDRETGKLICNNSEIKGCNILAADGMLYCMEDRSGRLCLVKLNENSIDFVSSFKVKLGSGPNIAHMSIANGLLFLRHGSVLMAYNIKK